MMTWQNNMWQDDEVGVNHNTYAIKPDTGEYFKWRNLLFERKGDGAQVLRVRRVIDISDCEDDIFSVMAEEENEVFIPGWVQIVADAPRLSWEEDQVATQVTQYHTGCQNLHN